jgi:hypothetical protein
VEIAAKKALRGKPAARVPPLLHTEAMIRIGE